MENIKGAFRGLVAIAGLVAAFALAAPQAWADAIVTVPAGGTIVNGDKTFNAFTCSVTGGSGALTCSGITASAYTSATPPDGIPGLLGIQFQAAFNSGNPGVEDITLGYNATINSGNNLFHDAQLTFNGNGLPPGMVATNVSEEIFIAGTSTLIGSVSVNNPPAHLTDDIVLSQDVSAITVVKDIELLSTSTTTPATISFVNQTFSQVAVPAPLIGQGLLVLLAVSGVLFGSKLLESLKRGHLHQA